MTNRGVLNLFVSLTSLDGNIRGVKVAYAVMINCKNLKAVVDSLRAGLKDYDAELAKINLMYCKRDNGEPVHKNNRYIFNDDVIELYTAAITELDEKYKTELAEYEKLLDEECTVSIHKIKLESVPEDISISQMNLLSGIILEEQ